MRKSNKVTIGEVSVAMDEILSKYEDIGYENFGDKLYDKLGHIKTKDLINVINNEDESERYVSLVNSINKKQHDGTLDIDGISPSIFLYSLSSRLEYRIKKNNIND